MKKLAFSSILLFAMSSASADPLQLLPAQFGSWTKGNCLEKPEASSLSMEAGSKEGAISCQYTSGENKIQIWVQKFHDPSSAYEVYTAGLRPGMMPSLVGNNAAVEDGALWMLTGNLVLRVSGQRQASEGDLRALVKLLDGHADKTPLPDIRAFLPSTGLIQGTQRYALGPEGYQAAVKALDRGTYAGLAPALGFGAK